ncbi:MAG TPA: hypothetical protein VF677_15685 [Flavobacterium sp.]|jgi:hypothetical protein
MSKFTLRFSFAVIFLSLILASCSGDSDGNEEQQGGISTGDYWPTAVNNRWIFEDEYEDQETMKILSTQNINGNLHYQYENFIGLTTDGYIGQAIVTSRKSNGDYFVRYEVIFPGSNDSPSITVLPVEYIILKDYLEVNQTWSQTLTQTTRISGFPDSNVTVQLNGKILEKNGTLTVNGTLYTNVIKSQLTQNTAGVTIENYYWFSKDVGLIQYQNIGAGLNIRKSLVSYSLN